MKGLFVLLWACIFLSGWGCSSTSYHPAVNRFSFAYNDQSYSIISIGVVGGNFVNYLLLREGNTVLLRARDNDLDGVLDTLLVGKIPLEKANEIYVHGISQAVTEGKYEQHQPSRVYVQKTAEGFLAIHSFERFPDTKYNRFVIQNDVEKTEVVLLDLNADGILDKIERGEGDLQTGQTLYERTLEAGIKTGQIVIINGFYLVRQITSSFARSTS